MIELPTGNRLEWKFTTPSSCPVDDEVNVTFPKDLFKFSLIHIDTNITAYNISNFTLSFPKKFSFDIPRDYDLANHALRIRFCDQELTDNDIPIIIINGRFIR